MKILWLSNCELTTQPTATTGSWLQAMSAALAERDDVELCNITLGRVKAITRCDCGNIKQWLIPKGHLKKGLPQGEMLSGLVNLIEEIAPDLVHIWGVELFWGLLTARGYIKCPTLLEIQGLRSKCADVWYGGMSLSEVVDSINPREVLLFKRGIVRKQLRERRKGRQEGEIISAHRHISVPSDWVKACIAPYCAEGTAVVQSHLPVRRAFLEAAEWNKPSTENGVELLAISSAPIPYKGIHVVLKALSLLKKRWPNVRLTIAGDYEQHRKGWKKSGYVRHLLKQIKRLGLEQNVFLPGALSAEQLAERMQQSHAMIHASFVESYSLALAESMVIGVPNVVAWSGAMPELSTDNRDALFYSPTDYCKCAWLVGRLVEDADLAQRLSSEARSRALLRNATAAVVDHQVDTYRWVLEGNR